MQAGDLEADSLGQGGRIPGEVASSGHALLDRLEAPLAGEDLRIKAPAVLDEVERSPWP